MTEDSCRASDATRRQLARGFRKHCFIQWMGTQNIVQRPWGKVLFDPTIGSKPGVSRRHLPLFQWSNPSVKGHMAVFTHSVVDNWIVPRTTGRDYFDQLTAEVREEREDTRGRIKCLHVVS